MGAGLFAPPAGGRGDNSAYKTLPEFCRITATMKPSSDSDIKLEVWLPTSGWNKKYQAVGNGAWAGSIVYGDMAKAIHEGYATSSTDTGHTGGSGSFALGHPEKLVDFGLALRARNDLEVQVPDRRLLRQRAAEVLLG